MGLKIPGESVKEHLSDLGTDKLQFYNIGLPQNEMLLLIQRHQWNKEEKHHRVGKESAACI